jgi:protein ImuB
MPVSVLGRWAPGPGDELAGVLARLGLTTLGAFAALDPGDVVGRFGAFGARAHRLARGFDPRPPATGPAPRDLRVTIELEPPAERVDAAAFAAKRLADELHAHLTRSGLACTRVEVVAETGHGEHCARTWRHEGMLDATAVAERVRWQLEGWLQGPAATRPTAGISRLTLAPDEVVPAHGRQLGFWGEETAGATRVARAVARLEGLLGPGAVVVPEWRGGRGPAERVGLVPAGAVDLTAPRTLVPPGGAALAPWPGRIPPPAPAAVHHEPIPAEVVDREGATVTVSGRGLASAPPARLSVDGGPWVAVAAWAGPWPAEERWWDPDGRRRRARLQVVAGVRAHLLALEGGRWWVEATYD